MNELTKSLKPTASFTFQNLGTVAKKLCLIPGHYDCSEVVPDDGKGGYMLAYSNPSAVSDAGFPCDQVADDYNYNLGVVKADGKYTVAINPKSIRTRFRDFLNYIRYSGLRVVKMRITDLLQNSNHEIFNQELEISASSIGSKAGSDFVQLSAHIDPSNYLQNFIDIDLEKRNLVLDETTLASLNIPAGAHFQIDFTLG